jgi:triosephosphate isomerase
MRLLTSKLNKPREMNMTPGIKPLVAGNWKMNGLNSSMGELEVMRDQFKPKLNAKIDMLVCLPFTMLAKAGELTSRSPVKIGAQNCHRDIKGAHTGDISIEMIADCGGEAVIVGHSERRTDHGETNAQICEKAQTVLHWGHMAVICIGESDEQRKQGATLDVLKKQMTESVPDSADNGEIIIAYEPIWAIGTGLTPTVNDVEEAHQFMRSYLIERFGEAGNAIRLLYGGSVKPSNAVELMGINNVDGALIGGASLKADDFLGICAAYQ